MNRGTIDYPGEASERRRRAGDQGFLTAESPVFFCPHFSANLCAGIQPNRLNRKDQSSDRGMGTEEWYRKFSPALIPLSLFLCHIRRSWKKGSANWLELKWRCLTIRT